MKTRVPGPAQQPLEKTLVGQKLGHYRLESLIGRGGTGVVFRARDTHLGRRVAIKVLEENSARQQAMFERFVQEARLAARLSHPNVVTIHEVNQDGSYVFIAMELLDGGSVQDRLEQDGPMDWRAAASALKSVCLGLDAAHTLGLIHRDIKPGNILADGTGQVKLGDFGLARQCATTPSSLTTDGMVIGTPLFMSPEQCEGQPADRRSDIYALGGTFYALLTGSPPYPGDEPLQIAFAHCSAPLPDPRRINGTIPEPCVAIIQRAMAKRPAERYQSAAEMLVDANDCLETSAASAPPIPPAIKTMPSRGNPRHPSRHRRHQIIVAIAAVLGLSVLFYSLFVLSIAGPIAVVKPDDATVASGSVEALPAIPARTDASTDFASLTTAEKLSVLFAEPGREEIRAARSEWKSISYEKQGWRQEGQRTGRAQVVSYRVGGARQYAMLKYPDDYSSEQQYAILVYCSENNGMFSPRELRSLQMRIPATAKCIVVIPVFRGHSVTLGRLTRQLRSEGQPGNALRETTDVMALLDLISQRISQADTSRLIVAGTGARSAVALQLGIRDPRVQAVLATEADTDCFQPYIHQAIVKAGATGVQPVTKLAGTVWREIAMPLLAGARDVTQARRELLSLSPARFVEYLPPTQLYYGAFSEEYEIRQGDVFRDRYLQDGRWKQYFVCRRFVSGPTSPLTIHTMQRSANPLVADVIHGKVNRAQ